VADERDTIMGEAREVMDRVTAAIFGKNLASAGDLYAADAVAVTPDQGQLSGRDEIVAYHRQLLDAFPDTTYEQVAAHESGNVAIDEGYVVGTHSGPLALPSGEVAATGRRIRVRSCDVATVDGGFITSHRFYFDQLEFLDQLGLLPETRA
jgi:ketosteroid isomerase-like protein